MGWRVEPQRKEVCPACRNGSGPPKPVQPISGITVDLVRQVLRDVLPEVLFVGVWAAFWEGGRFPQISIVIVTPFWIFLKVQRRTPSKSPL